MKNIHAIVSSIKKDPKTIKMWPFIMHFLRDHSLIAFLFVLCAVIAGTWHFFNGALLKEIINIVNDSPANLFSALLWPGILFVFNYEFSHLMWRGMQYISYKNAYTIKNDMIGVMFHYLHHHTPQFFHANLVGSLVNQIKVVADNMERILTDIFRHIIRGVVALLIAFVGVYTVHPLFFSTLLIWFLVFSYGTFWMFKRLLVLAEKQAAKESILMGQLTDSISNASSVRIFSRMDYEKKYINNFLTAIKTAYQEKEFFSFSLYFFQGLSISVLLSFMLYFLCHLYSQHLVTSGDFALILVLSSDLGYLTWQTMEQIDEYNKARGKCLEGLSCIFHPLTIKDAPHAVPLHVQGGEIHFSHVTFHYNEKTPLFKDLSLTIPAKQKVAFVGYSGSGKSSFFSLLLRLYDPTGGHIFIDEQDIRLVTQESLHKNLSLIPQNPYLFDRSLMENIRYGCEKAGDDAVIEAAKKALAHDFILNLAEGYATNAGENGKNLSGGQRQRIAIARAILKDSPIIMMDEATSQLDAVTEKEVHDILVKFTENKTTLVIAHRLATLIHADRILVFEKGHIIEDGNHQELLERDGLYTKLWNTQKDGMIPHCPLF